MRCGLVSASSALLVAAVAAGCGGGGSGTSTAQLPSDQRAQIDAGIQAGLRESQAPGAIVGVDTPDGRYVKAVGIADKASNAPMSTDMHQRIGSLTKTFTAAVLMQLIGENKLSLDDTIDKYIKRVPNGQPDHAARPRRHAKRGRQLHEGPEVQEGAVRERREDLDPEELVKIGIANSPDFKPGTGFEYSNTNYVMLGLVIEQVERKPIGDVYKERIFDPLKLSETFGPTERPSSRIPTPRATRSRVRSPVRRASRPIGIPRRTSRRAS